MYLIFSSVSHTLTFTRDDILFFFVVHNFFVHDVSMREKAQTRKQKQANYPINNVTNRSCGASKGINPAQVVILLPNVFIGAAFARRQSAPKEDFFSSFLCFCIASH